MPKQTAKQSPRIHWKRQPPTARTCGHVAVAVLCGVSVAAVIKFLGHSHGTTTKELIRAIRHFSHLRPIGKSCRRWPRAALGEGALATSTCEGLRPELGLAQVRSPHRSGWHWVVVKGDRIYDGAFGRPNGTVSWPSHYRLTSYLPLE